MSGNPDTNTKRFKPKQELPRGAKGDLLGGLSCRSLQARESALCRRSVRHLGRKADFLCGDCDCPLSRDFCKHFSILDASMDQFRHCPWLAAARMATWHMAKSIFSVKFLIKIKMLTNAETSPEIGSPISGKLGNTARFFMASLPVRRCLAASKISISSPFS
jgi:hypothetical protein